MEKPLNIKEAAEKLGVSVPTMYGKVHRKEIPFYKPAGKLYFYESELDAWIRGETTKREEK